MAPLPTVGGSTGTWGTELNTWLTVSHNSDGTLKEVVQNTRTTYYTLALSDAGKVIEMNVTVANDLTIPLNSSVAFPIGTIIEVTQIGVGVTTIQPVSGGVTIRSVSGLRTLAGQYASVSLRKRATDEWMLVGDLA